MVEKQINQMKQDLILKQGDFEKKVSKHFLIKGYLTQTPVDI